MIGVNSKKAFGALWVGAGRATSEVSREVTELVCGSERELQEWLTFIPDVTEMCSHLSGQPV